MVVVSEAIELVRISETDNWTRSWRLLSPTLLKRSTDVMSVDDENQSQGNKDSCTKQLPKRARLLSYQQADFLNQPQATLTHLMGYQPPIGHTGHDRMLNEQVQMVPTANGCLLVPRTGNTTTSSNTSIAAILQQQSVVTGQPEMMFSVLPFGNQGYIATPVGYQQPHGHPLPSLNSNYGAWSSAPPAASPPQAEERDSSDAADPNHQQPMPNLIDNTNWSSGVASLPSSSQNVNFETEQVNDVTGLLASQAASSSTGITQQEVMCINPIRLSVSSIASLQASLHEPHAHSETLSGRRVSATSSAPDASVSAHHPNSDTADSKPSGTTGGSTSAEGSSTNSGAGSKQTSEDGKTVQNLLEAAIGKSSGSEGEDASPSQLDKDFGNFLLPLL